MATRYAQHLLCASAGAMVLITGCGSDDDRAMSNNRDSGTDHGQTSVQNAYIVPAYRASCALQRDAPASLSFTAINDSPAESERLLDISTPAAASVSINVAPSALRMPPRTAIAAGQPRANPDPHPSEHPGPSATFGQPFSVTLIRLADTVEPGRSFPVTFGFERAGELTVDVAVEACPAQTTK